MAISVQDVNKNSMKNKRFHPYNKKGNKKPEDVNIQQNIEQNVQQVDRNEQQLKFQSPYAQPMIRLLARRYALTSKKYIEVGISVKNESSYVEIALGEMYKKEIVLDLKDWKKMIQYKPFIIEYFQTGKKIDTPMNINPKTLILLDMYKDIKVIYISQNKNSLILAESTFKFLLTLENCVKCYYKNLSNVAELMDEKIDILKNIKDKENHESFDKSSIFDNELHALYFNNKQ